MKRIEAVVQSEAVKKVVDAISKHKVSVTIIAALGKGQGERPWIGGEKGRHIEFNSTDVIISIVDDSDVDAISLAIMDAAHTGSKGDGIILVTDVERAYDITTKNKI